MAAACGGNGGGGGGGGATPKATESPESPEEGGTITLDGQSANDHGTKDVSGMDEFSVEADDFYFEPTVLTGTAGQKIEIEVENEGNVEHNFSLTDQGIDQDVSPGQKAKVDVTFPQSGTLVFFCKFHQSQGMVGALEIG
jgi:plastocyanin